MRNNETDENRKGETSDDVSLGTMDLGQAAAFLRMNPEALRQETKVGLIPGAKIGKCWQLMCAENGSSSRRSVWRVW